MKKTFCLALCCWLVCVTLCPAQKRLVLIDQDGSGPGGSDQMAMLALLQSPDVQVLGITIVTGDAWRDEETLHTLRMLELTGHADVPVARGAVFPLVRDAGRNAPRVGARRQSNLAGRMGTRARTSAERQPAHARSGSFESHGPYEIPPMPEGLPTTKPLDEDAAHFLIRQVRAHPHQVTIYAAGPLTNIALAVALDPEFAALTKGIVIMGGSLNPQTSDPEIRHRARATNSTSGSIPRPRTSCCAPIGRASTSPPPMFPSRRRSRSRCSTRSRSRRRRPRATSPHGASSAIYMWDELEACAWLDPAIITKEQSCTWMWT